MPGLLGGQVPLDRVVAVVVDLGQGRTKWGSGFLLTATRVLTAWHCTIGEPRSAPKPERPVVQVWRHTPAAGWQSAQVTHMVSSHQQDHTPGGYEWGVDVAVLELADPPWGDPGWQLPPPARVDRTVSGDLVDVVAVGYPAYMLGSDLQRDTSEVRGSIRQGSGAVSGYLLLHDDKLGSGLRPPEHLTAGQAAHLSPWGGLSGAAVFHKGRLLGHVVQHRPHCGDNTLIVVPLNRIKAAKPGSRARTEVAPRLGLEAVDDLPVAVGATVRLWKDALTHESLAGGLAPQPVGQVGNLAVFGVHPSPLSAAVPRYVERDRDPDLTAALGRAVGQPLMVLVVGDSAAGKSRAAAEAVRRHPELAARSLLVPRKDGGLNALLHAGIPLADSVLWLDDLDQYLVGGLDVDQVARFLDEHRPAVAVATIRAQQMAARTEALSDPARAFLTDQGRVLRVDLASGLSDDEVGRLQDVATDPDLLAKTREGVGLGAWLISGLQLVQRLENVHAGGGSPTRAALADVVLDWYRTGLQRPLPTDQARRLWDTTQPAHPTSTTKQDQYFHDALDWLCQSLPDFDQPREEQALAEQTDDGLRPHDYLVDHATRNPQHPVPDTIWQHALNTATTLTDPTIQPSALWSIGATAYNQRALPHALTAMQALADTGDAEALANTGVLLAELGHKKEAIAVYDQLADTHAWDPDPAVRAVVAKALLGKGITLGQLDRSTEEIDVYDQLVEDYGADQTPGVREQVATALLNKGIALGQLDRSTEEIDVYDQLVEDYGADPTPGVREQIAKALLNKGIALGQLDRSTEEIDVYDQLVEDYGADPTPGVREQIAKALVNKGYRLYQLDRSTEAIGVYDQLVEDYGADPTPGVREQIAKALVNKGYRLYQLDRSTEAIGVYDQLVEDYGADPTPGVREQIATALLNKGITLGQLDRSAEEIDVYDQLVEDYGADPTPGVREQIAKALLNKGITLGQLDRSAEAIDVYDQLVENYGADPTPGVREQIAKALVGKGIRLGELDRSAEAIDVYDQLVENYGADPTPGVREQIAKALVGKGIRLGELDRSAEAIDVYDQLVEDYGADPTPGVREQIAKALLGKGYRLGELDRSAEEIDVYDQLVEDYGADPTPGGREQIAKALLNKGITLGQLDRSAEEIDVYDQLVEDYGADPTPGVREQIAKALLNKGITLGQLDRSAEEIDVYDQLVEDYGADPTPGVREQIAKALLNKGVRLGRLRDEQGAIESWQRTMDEFDDIASQVAAAAMSLAALSAVDRLDSAPSHLRTAQEAGAPLASTCAESLSPDLTTRTHALEALLAAAPDDSDALNFLGIAALHSGDLAEARSLWTESSLAGDTVAALLLTRLHGA